MVVKRDVRFDDHRGSSRGFCAGGAWGRGGGREHRQK